MWCNKDIFPLMETFCAFSFSFSVSYMPVHDLERSRSAPREAPLSPTESTAPETSRQKSRL